MFKKLFLFFTISLFFSPMTPAEKMTKKSMQEALKMIKKTGMISAEEVSKLEKEIEGMSDKDIQEQEKKAVDYVKKNPGLGQEINQILKKKKWAK